MAIQILGSAQKIRVGRESGNTTFIFLGLIRVSGMTRISLQWLHMYIIYILH